MADFGLIRPFNIDNGELDGFTPQQCFVLGYELAQVDAAILFPIPIGKPVHAANQDRIKSEFEKAGRPFTLTWMENDSSEQWMWLESPAPDKQESNDG